MRKELPEYIPEFLRSSVYETFKRDCVACGTNSVAYVAYFSEGHGRVDGSDVSCPECDYNPKLDKELGDILSHQIEVRINSAGCRINSEELIELVLSKVRKFWPRPAGEEDEGGD
ncbi:MAG: hypothetical protein KJ718_06440 [Nanoarchaeota archaeon]|nr:hypothetical protein [Nanoarchaeota archaeon]MBU1052156.1 hypothetical protein [Nanoarchaeota archaeon]MBU1988123.1 hypothetical protein [Nanoarchaeota archaeon]